MKKKQSGIESGRTVHEQDPLAERFEQLVEEARRDPCIMALWLDGSRGKGVNVTAHLEAAEAVSPLLAAIFALHGRVKPYHKYLQWELETYPLDKFPWKANTLISHLLDIIERGDTEVLVEVRRKTPAPHLKDQVLGIVQK
ncbi:MAG: hypothetical protein GY866_37040 [Proteobacteria bacterium]|nr:hypothetical protein [Pseudomonadota bacterium]